MTHREHSYSSSDVANEFHTSPLTALSDSFGVSTPKVQPTAIKALYVRRQSVNKTILSDQYIFSQKSNLGCLVIRDGSEEQKYCNGLTLSLQQHEKMRLKQLFNATDILCILVSIKCQTSQP